MRECAGGSPLWGMNSSLTRHKEGRKMTHPQFSNGQHCCTAMSPVRTRSGGSTPALDPQCISFSFQGVWTVACPPASYCEFQIANPVTVNSTPGKAHSTRHCILLCYVCIVFSHHWGCTVGEWVCVRQCGQTPKSGKHPFSSGGFLCYEFQY